MRGKNSGFTLIELIVSMAILSLIGVAIATFFYTSTRQYNAASADVELQTESQMVQNQMQNLLLDASRGIFIVPAGGSYRGNRVEIYNYYEDTRKKEKIEISYVPSDTELVYSKFYLDNADGTWKVDADVDKECFARYVADFSMELCDKEGNVLADTAADQGIGQVRVKISYLLGGKTYQSEFVVTPRNPVKITNNVNVLYKATE